MIRVAIAAGHWLDVAAAASYARMRAAGMPGGGITEAGRTRARQQELYAQYLAGQLVAYAARPGESKHETGSALDLVTAHAAHRWMLTHGAAYGWTRPLLHATKPEPWHWEYRASADRHLTDDAAPVAPIAPVTPRREDPEMYLWHTITPWGEDRYGYTTATAGAGQFDANTFQHLAHTWPTKDLPWDVWLTEIAQAHVRAGADADTVAAAVAELVGR